jgi:serine/threonine protein kinase
MDEKVFSKQNTLQDVKGHVEEILPEKIGPYLIEALIAKSHYSIIYLGYDAEQKKVVALKVLSPDFVQKKAMISSFINEGSIIKMASHPNIVKLYAQGQWEGGLYIAMEFIRGVSLRQFIQSHPLSMKRCLDIVLQVCYALCHLHAHGIIHGDLKPENILLTEDGEIKVLDFGIAKIHNISNADVSHAGTPSYMSPEHKMSAKNLTYSSDIYSLGLIAYELITGKLCFGVVQLDKIPESLRPIISKCLHKSLKDRYQDVVDLIHDLSLFFKSDNVLEKTVSSPVSTIENDYYKTLKELFPLPEIYIDPLDFGIARPLFLHDKIHLVIAHPLEDNGVILGQIQSPTPSVKGSFSELMVLSFIKSYLYDLKSKKFVFKDFLQKINLLCFEVKIQLDFSFVHLDSYMDDIHVCYGGFLAPFLIKNQKMTSSIGLKNLHLGKSLDLLSIGSHSFSIGDQLIMHSLKIETDLNHLEKIYSQCSLYSSQILADTLIKKSALVNLTSIICCLKVK